MGIRHRPSIQKRGWRDPPISQKRLRDAPTSHSKSSKDTTNSSHANSCSRLLRFCCSRGSKLVEHKLWNLSLAVPSAMQHHSSTASTTISEECERTFGREILSPASQTRDTIKRTQQRLSHKAVSRPKENKQSSLCIEIQSILSTKLPTTSGSA